MSMTPAVRSLHERLLAAEDAEALHHIALLIGGDYRNPQTIVRAAERLCAELGRLRATPLTQEMPAIRPAPPQRAE